jgi:transmembrane sensor
VHSALPDPVNDAAEPLPSIDETAQAWIVRLASGEMEEGEFDALALWRSADPEHDAAFVAARRLWQRSGGYEPAFREQDAFAAARSRTRRTIRRAVGALAASLALVIAVPASLGTPLWAADYEAEGGVPRQVALADGSRVLLDAGAAIDFHEAGGVRRVDLRQGSAFFDVAHDPAHPFKVYGGEGVATAVGTAFAVQRDGDEATVSVTEGRVYVESAGKGKVIGAGIEASWRRGMITPSRAFDPGKRLAWRHGRLVIESMPLGAALSELERYDAGYVVLLDDAAASRRVSGVFLTRNAREAIGILARTQGLSVRQVTPYLTILS